MELRCLRLLPVLCKNRWHGKSQVALSSIQYHMAKSTSVWTSSHSTKFHACTEPCLEFFRYGMGTSGVQSILRKVNTQPTPPSSSYTSPAHILQAWGIHLCDVICLQEERHQPTLSFSHNPCTETFLGNLQVRYSYTSSEVCPQRIYLNRP